MSNSAHRGKPRRRPAVIALITLGALVAGGTAAYAYWTTTGSGTGSAATGSNDPITVVQTSTVTDLAPGSGTQALSGNFNNPNPGPVSVGDVTVVSITTGDPGCTEDDYTITGTGTVAGDVVPTGTGVGGWSGLSIEFFNDPVRNQDACQGETITINYAVDVLSD